MTSLAAVLSFGCAFVWCGLDLARKKLAGRATSTGIVVLLMLVQLPAFLTWLAIEGGAGPGTDYWLPACLSIAANALANVLFVEAVRISPFSRTVPFLSLSPVFSAAIALPILGEAPGMRQLAGIVAVVLGALALNSDLAQSRGPAGLWRAFVQERGSPMMALVALLWSATAVLDKTALRHASTPFHAVLVTGGAIVVLAPLLLRKRLRDPAAGGGKAGWLLVAAVSGSLAYGLQLHAFRVTQVAYVEAVKRAVGVAFAILAGRASFGESFTTQKTVAAILMMAGVTLILW